MLVLSRRLGEKLIIGDSIKLTIHSISNSQIRFCIDAPKEINIYREEVFLRLQKEK